jgi:drug/metabolite transporter (DMT)-like permease
MANLSQNMRGALFMIAAMVAFTLNDAFMKGLAGEMPMFQALFLRGGVTSVLLGLLIWRMGAFSFRMSRRDLTLVALRSLSEAMGAYFFITALFHMPIANVSAILQALPLTITLAGAVFLGEPVGWRRFAAIVVGFGGVLLIVQPGTDAFNSYSVYAILAVVVVTFRDLVVRRMSSAVSSQMVALSAAVSATALAGLASIGDSWVAVAGDMQWKLAGASVFVIGGYLFSVSAMRAGEIGFVSPFRYSSLLVALALGAFVFGEWPDHVTLIGAAIVVMTGAFTLYCERRAMRAVGPVGLRIR